MRVQLAALVAATLVNAASSIPKATLLTKAPAGYPVPFLVNGSLAYATAESPQGSTRRIVLLRRTPQSPPSGGPWEKVSVVVEDDTSSADLANGYCLQLQEHHKYPGFDGSIMCAYRHHIPNGSATLYRIRAVRSGDNGATWSDPVTITEGPVGVWEPFLYLSTGVPPAIGPAVDPAPVLRVLISSEITNGGEQDITQQDSWDGGLTWTNVTARVHTPGSRNGMPGLTPLVDGSLLMVMEGFWGAAGWGAFTVGSVRSFDGGATWGQPVLVHAPAGGCNAGAPKVGLCAINHKINVVLMSNAPLNGSDCGPDARPGWPGNAVLNVKAAFLNKSNYSAPLNFTGSAVGTLPIITPTVLWPAIFMDVTDLGASSERVSSKLPFASAEAVSARVDVDADSMRVAYLGDDGAAYLSDGTLCID